MPWGSMFPHGGERYHMNNGVWLREADGAEIPDLIDYPVAAVTAGGGGAFVSDALPITEFWIR